MTKARYLTIDADGRRVTARYRPVPCRARTEEAMAKRLEDVGCETRVPGENQIVAVVRAHRRTKGKAKRLTIRHAPYAAGYVFADAERANDARREVNERLDTPQLRKPLDGSLSGTELDDWSSERQLQTLAETMYDRGRTTRRSA